MKRRDFAAGGYRYIEGVFQYSAGVQALKGYEIVRLRFREPPPLAEGFRRIERHLGDIGRPLAAFCACELRSPAPFSEAGFRAFNEGTKESREVDFIAMRQALACGQGWDDAFTDSLMPGRRA